MKKLIFTLIITVSAFFAVSQAWEKNLPQEKVENGSVNFFDIQKAFNDYCEEHNIINGIYYENGIQKKLSGYKQFKRWEYEWQRKVDPLTGEFPVISADEILKNSKIGSGKISAKGYPWQNTGITEQKDVGRLNCIAFHPTIANRFYVGAPSGGVWRTNNGGSSWTCLTDDLPALGVSSIIIVPNGGVDIIYIGTGDRDWSSFGSNGIGVLKSIDGGITWNTTGLNSTPANDVRVNKLLKDPSNDNILYAATNIGFYKTLNAGVDWDLKLSQEFSDIEFHPGSSGVIYGASLFENDGFTRIYRNAFAGSTESWVVILEVNGLRTELAVTPDDPDRLYAVVADNNQALEGIYQSIDVGVTFEKVFSGTTKNLLGWKKDGSDFGVGQGWYDLALAADPNNANVLYVGGINTWKSIDGGDSWNLENLWTGEGPVPVSTPLGYAHADKHYFAFKEGSSVLYECNDGGLYVQRFGPYKWWSLSKDLVISQIYRLGLGKNFHSGSAGPDILAGLQDNGTFMKYYSNWTDIQGGDGMECIIDHTVSYIKYASLYNGEIRKYLVTGPSLGLGTGITHDGNGTFYGGLTETGAWVTPYVMHPDDHNTLYLGMNNVWVSNNGGGDWNITNSAATFSGSQLNSLAVSPSNPDYIYAATNSNLYMTSDGGNAWSEITPKPGLTITYISVKDDDPETIWISCGGYNSDGVLEITNSGSNWNDISDGLPAIPINCIIQNKMNKSQTELYAGTETGVYVKFGEWFWEPYNRELPNVSVTELEIYYSKIPDDSKLYAATYGRGMWHCQLSDNIPTATWTGIYSQVYDESLNWLDEIVPTGNHNAIIPGDCPYYPVIPELEVGVHCNGLKINDGAEFTVLEDFTIMSEKIVYCMSNSLLKIGGAWINENGTDEINNGYGFLPEPGSEVIFTYQNHAPVYALHGSETFQRLTVNKVWSVSSYFNPQADIIAMEECNILTGLWKDTSELHHQMHSNLTISEVAAFNCTGILEFCGGGVQIFSFLTNLYDHDIYNYLGTVKINAIDVLQVGVLTENKKINNDLDITLGIYGIAPIYATEASGVIIQEGGTLNLDKGTLYAGGIEVKHGGLLQSIGSDSDHAGIIKLPGSIEFNLLIHGTIDALYTDFEGTNQFGVHITANGEILNIDNCTFTSTSPTVNAALLRINNDQIVSLNNLGFSFLAHHKTVTKSSDQGEVNIFVYDPIDSHTKELDPFIRIHWNTSPPEKVAFEELNTRATDQMEKIRVYPNPSSEFFVIENDYLNEGIKTFQITNLHGKEIYSGNLPTGKTTVNTGNISKGLYLLKIVIGDQYIIKKIVIN